ncbi:lectin, galactoside-binding, soluble, 2b [Aplochiton taeniatus]
MSFKQGQELKITVLPNSDASTFAINLGHDSDNFALHFNPRFHNGTIVCNSLSGGTWGDEQQEGCQPFQAGAENKVTVNFNMDQFHIKLPDGNTIYFPNRLGEVKYNHFDISGDARIIAIKIK